MSGFPPGLPVAVLVAMGQVDAAEQARPVLHQKSMHFFRGTAVPDFRSHFALDFLEYGAAANGFERHGRHHKIISARDIGFSTNFFRHKALAQIYQEITAFAMWIILIPCGLFCRAGSHQ
jgi:hypothetical protein